LNKSHLSETDIDCVEPQKAVMITRRQASLAMLAMMVKVSNDKDADCGELAPSKEGTELDTGNKKYSCERNPFVFSCLLFIIQRFTANVTANTDDAVVDSGSREGIFLFYLNFSR
jgi:hypothetical protein